jgi:hypothetical protein
MHGLIVDPATSAAASNDGRKTRGRPFQPGNRLGRGRPVGSRNRATLILDAVAGGECEAVLKTMLRQAKAGDTRAQKWCWRASGRCGAGVR